MIDDSGRAHEESRQAWEANAAFWDDQIGEGNDFVNVLIWPVVHSLLGAVKGLRILDVGCGNGLYARRLAALGAHVTAVDYSPEMIVRARERSAGLADVIRYSVVDATDEEALLALGAGQYDAAMCNMALFDMSEVQTLMKALPRLLRPGGRFVFSVMHPCFNTPLTTHVAELQDRAGEIVTEYSVKVSRYMTCASEPALALRDQPRAQIIFHRPLHELLRPAFEAGFVLDRLEERAFPPDHPRGKDGMSWGGNWSEIPPVLIARMRIGGGVEGS